jgi:hypothetical protein
MYENQKNAVRTDSGLKDVSFFTRMENFIVKSAFVLARVIVFLKGI